MDYRAAPEVCNVTVSARAMGVRSRQVELGLVSVQILVVTGSLEGAEKCWHLVARYCMRFRKIMPVFSAEVFHIQAASGMQDDFRRETPRNFCRL